MNPWTNYDDIPTSERYPLMITRQEHFHGGKNKPTTERVVADNKERGLRMVFKTPYEAAEYVGSTMGEVRKAVKSGVAINGWIFF